MASSLYRPAGSFLHRTDALAKMIALAAWFGVALAARRPPLLVGLAIAAPLLATWAGVLEVLRRFAGFMVATFLACALLWGLLSAQTGFLGGLWMGLRLAVMLAFGLVFLAATRVEEVSAALQRLGLPFMAAFSLTLAFRLMPLFAATAGSIAQAQASRGLDLKAGGPLRRLKAYLPLMIPLVLSGLRAADALAAALESRGLGAARDRTSVMAGRFGPREILVAGGSAAAAAVVAYLRWGSDVV